MDKERFSEGRQSLDDISIFAIKRKRSAEPRKLPFPRIRRFFILQPKG